MNCYSILIYISFLFTCVTGQALVIESKGSHLYLSESVIKNSPDVFAVKLAQANLELAFKGDKDTPLTLHLDLPEGGLGYYAFEIVDIIRKVQAHGTAIDTVVEEGKKCVSACTFIFMAGSRRYAHPTAQFYFHGFTYDPEQVPQRVIDQLTARYNKLLGETHPNLLKFFNEFQIIEKNKWIAFSGQTLFEYELFEGFISGLL